MKQIRWVIPHPGTGKWQECESFDEAMTKWFEGFNLPRRVEDDSVEDISDSYQRVEDHFTASRSK